MKGLALLVPLALLALACQGKLLEQFAAASSPEEEGKLVVAASQNLIRAFGEELKTDETLRDRGVVSNDEVDMCKLQIARAKHYLASHQNNADVARDQSREIVEIRGRQLDRELKLSDMRATTETELDAAKRNLAVARFWLAADEGKTDAAVRELKLVVEICEREHKRELAQQRRGEIAENNVMITEYHLAMAHYYLAKLQEQKAEGVRHLKSVMGICEAWLEKERTLARLNAGSDEGMDTATIALLWAQHRLAVEEGKPDLVKELLGRLISLREKLLKSDMWRDPQEKADMQWLLAFERFRLAQASVGINVEFSLNWELETPKSQEDVYSQLLEVGRRRNCSTHHSKHR
jgi:hypothetical protein